MKCISNKKQDWQRSVPMTEFGGLFLVEVEEWFCLNFLTGRGAPYMLITLPSSPWKAAHNGQLVDYPSKQKAKKIAKAAAMAINNPQNRKCGYCKMTTELYYIEVARF